ncbi:MAG: D-alanyl-D-alanine carboxypeptidase family protein [Rhodoplanes sp.]|jgi:D-alanyl-D-alanine carboxypeptidase (penicillin-binding protein 5/6)
MIGVLALLVVAGAAPNPVSGPKKEDGGFQTSAPYAILIDAETGTVLFEKAADEPTPPSSLAKLMTAEIIFNEIAQGRLTRDTEMMISEDAWRRGGAPSRTSSMFAPIHSRVRVEDLLRGLIIQSANDAAIALAAGISGNERAFAVLMNKRARELGLVNFNFANSTGLPEPSQKVSVRDLAKLARHIIRTYPEFYPIYGEREFTWNKIRQQNRNPLLPLNIGADGMKTGYTRDGGFGLVGTAVQNGLRLIVVVNGLKTAKDRADEAKKLLEWGFSGFEQRPLFVAGEVLGQARVFGGTQTSVGLVGPKAISMLIPRNSRERISAKIVYTGPVPAPIQEGQRIGTLKVFRGTNVALEVPLQAMENVDRGNLSRRAYDAASELVIGLFRAGIAKI